MSGTNTITFVPSVPETFQLAFRDFRETVPVLILRRSRSLVSRTLKNGIERVTGVTWTIPSLVCNFNNNKIITSGTQRSQTSKIITKSGFNSNKY